MQISSAKDKNPVFGVLCFYGIITEIWDLDYTMFRIPVFKCNWVDNKSDIKVDDHPLITTLPQVESFDTMDDFDVICIRGDYEGF